VRNGAARERRGVLLLTVARRALAIAVLAIVPAVPAQAATGTWTGLALTTTSIELGSSLKATATVGSSAPGCRPATSASSPAARPKSTSIAGTASGGRSDRARSRWTAPGSL
jgi:hypothetical protein